MAVPDNKMDESTKMRRSKLSRKTNKDYGGKRAGTVSRSPSPKTKPAKIPEPTVVRLNVSRGSQLVSRPLSV